jgi:hypothetical protein
MAFEFPSLCTGVFALRAFELGIMNLGMASDDISDLTSEFLGRLDDPYLRAEAVAQVLLHLEHVKSTLAWGLLLLAL